MKILSPLCITSRLLPGVEIGRATISIEYTHVTRDRRQAYRWFIDVGTKDPVYLQGDDLCSGVGGGTLQEGLESLLGFLAAFAESCRDHGCVSDLFPIELADWAIANIDEISMLECELEEHPGEFIVE